MDQPPSCSRKNNSSELSDRDSENPLSGLSHVHDLDRTVFYQHDGGAGLYIEEDLNKAEKIVNVLVQYIHDKKLQSAAKLPSERMLSSQLKVGNRSLREALVILKAIGVVRAKNGVGWYVGEFNPVRNLRFLSPILKEFCGAEVKHIMISRLSFEPMIAQQAAQNITSQGLEKLFLCLTKMEENSSDLYYEMFRDYDRQFHNILANESGNPVFSIISSVMTGLFYSMPWWRTGGNYDRILQQHKDLYQAVKESDGAKAFQIMKEHINNSWKFVKEVIAKEEKRIKNQENRSIVKMSNQSKEKQK